MYRLFCDWLKQGTRDPIRKLHQKLLLLIIKLVNFSDKASLNSVIVNPNFLGNDKNISDKDFVKEAFNILTGDCEIYS